MLLLVILLLEVCLDLTCEEPCSLDLAQGAKNP